MLLQVGVANYRFLSWDLDPGDIMVHHRLTVHGAGGNKSQLEERIGLSNRYMGGDVVWDPRAHVLVFPGTEHFETGVSPNDDTVFPVAWRASGQFV